MPDVFASREDSLNLLSRKKDGIVLVRTSMVVVVGGNRWQDMLVLCQGYFGAGHGKVEARSEGSSRWRKMTKSYSLLLASAWLTRTASSRTFKAGTHYC
jgi:hypothetical protein